MSPVPGSGSHAAYMSPITPVPRDKADASVLSLSHIYTLQKERLVRGVTRKNHKSKAYNKTSFIFNHCHVLNFKSQYYRNKFIMAYSL